MSRLYSAKRWNREIVWIRRCIRLQLAEDRSRGSDDADTLLKPAKDDAPSASQYGMDVLAQGFKTGIEQNRSNVGESTTDHNDFRIEHLHNCRERDSEITSSGDDGILSHRIAKFGDLANMFPIDDWRILAPSSSLSAN